MNDLEKIMADPFEFVSRLKIIDKNGKLIELSPNQEQLHMIEALEEDRDVYILKPRQIGSSTLNVAYMFWKWFTAKEPLTQVFMSHKSASSKHLLQIAKKMFYQLPTELQREIEVDNTTTFRLKDTGSELKTVSAQSKGGLRSFTCSRLLISEIAFAERPDEMMAAAIASLNNGQLIVESTANFYNDILHRSVMKIQNGTLNATALFFPWTSHAEYKTAIKVEDGFCRDLEERDLDMTDEQVLWRRDKISKLGWEKFVREFPLTIEEAYTQTGSSYLPTGDLKNIDIIQVSSDEMIYLATPERDDKYAIGVDVAAGVGRDFSSIYVVSKKTYQTVAIYRSNKITPVSLANRIVDLSKEYEGARVLVESNNFGHVVLNEMSHQGFSNFWKCQEGRDWTTTGKNKKEMFENMKSKIRSGHIRSMDNILFSEVRSLQVDERGNIGIPDTYKDSHGDNAIAFALAHMCLNTISLMNNAFLPDWIHKQKANKTIKNAGASVGGIRRY